MNIKIQPMMAAGVSIPSDRQSRSRSLSHVGNPVGYDDVGMKLGEDDVGSGLGGDDDDDEGVEVGALVDDEFEQGVQLVDPIESAHVLN